MKTIRMVIISLIYVSACLILHSHNHTFSQAELHVEKDILFATTGGVQLKGDMYVPEGDGPFPGILNIHGGGFVGGDKGGPAMERFVRFFAENGYVVFSVNYRTLQQGGMFPNNIKDVKCALAWMKANAGKYGIDTSRIGVTGESAGGYLAAMIALTPNMKEFQPDCEGFNDADTSVLAGALFYAPFNFTTFNVGFSHVLEVELRSRAKLRKKKDVEAYKAAYSPVTYAASAPPLYLSFSNPDIIVPVSQQYEMIDALKKADRIFEYYEATGKGIDHGFVLVAQDTPQAIEAKTRAVAFLDKHVKNAKPPAVQ